jgi:hypothetical protein
LLDEVIVETEEPFTAGGSTVGAPFLVLRAS